jgi:hypothetical protein
MVVALFALPVAAQEIGSEIPNNNNSNGAKSSPDNYNNPYSKDGNAVPPPPPPPSASNLASPHGSAGRGAIGLSTYFGGSAAAPISVASGASGGSAGPVGLSTFSVAIFLADVLRLNINAGFGMSFAGQTPLGFQIGASVDIVLKGTDSPVRPFITIGADFAKAVSQSDNYGLNPSVGFGGEYYLSPNFCLSVRALVSMPILLTPGTVLLVAFSPSVGATVYF